MGQGDVSDTGKKKTLSLGNGEPLSLRKPGESVGSPARGGMGGGRKTVQVEVRRRRALARANQAAGDVAGVSRNVAPNQTVGSEPVVDSKLALRSSADSLGTVEIASGRARHVLKTLSTEEKSARAKALDNAQAADQAARARAEDNARRQVEEATRLASEREAADARRSEEEERKKTEEEARRRAEEEAARKLTEKEAKVAAPVQDFVVPQYVNFTVIQAVLEKFGLGSEGITYDINSGTISLIGMASRIQDIKLLIQQLEKSAESRQKRELIDRRSEYEGRLYQELLSAKVKVIPLRYASVSETTKVFQGKSISVPGIEETLQAILGVQINKSGDRAQNQSGLVIGGSGNVSSEHSALYRLKQLTRPSISVDRRTNSVIVRGSELAIKEVEEVIRQLDQPQTFIYFQF